MKNHTLCGLGLLLAALPFPAAAQDCPADLTPGFSLRELHKCPALYKKLCVSVCGPRYDEAEPRAARQLPTGEQAVVCLDSSLEDLKNGVQFSADREQHKCYSGAEKVPVSEGGERWCVRYGYSYGARKLEAYLQCAGRLKIYGSESTGDDAPGAPAARGAAAPGAAYPVVGFIPPPQSMPEEPVVRRAAPAPRQAAPQQAAAPQQPAPAAPRSFGEEIEDYSTNPFEAKITASKMEEAFALLKQLRSAVKRYHEDNGGFPPDLAALAPKYIKEVPALELPGCKKNSWARGVGNLNGGEACAAARDAGGWLYVTDPASKSYGRVFFDSVKRYRGKPLCGY